MRAIVRASWGFTDTAAIAKITLKSVVTGSSGVYPFAPHLEVWVQQQSSQRRPLRSRTVRSLVGHKAPARNPHVLISK